MMQHDDAAINTVKIYDHVYNPETCLLLHQLAKEHSDMMGDDSSIFYRHQSQNNVDVNGTTYQEMTVLEYAIDNILTYICNDTTTNVVEYWSRQDYLNMDVHCDIDEKLLEIHKKRRVVRCPEYAHIVYLTVQLPTNVTAPTCIFPTKLGGWKTTSTTNSIHVNTNSIQNHTKTIVDVVIVPAVSGRVVRFPGSMMHAVPKPSDQWFLSTTTTTTTTSNVDDDDENENTNELRSVLLFNCWSNDMPPPIGLKTYNNYLDNLPCPTSDFPDGIVIDDDDDEHVHVHATLNDPTRNSDMSMASNVDYRQRIFVINDQWEAAPIIATKMNQSEISTPSTTTSPVRVRLMGNKYRRQYHKAVAQLSIYENDTETIIQAIKEPVFPTRIQLWQINDE